VGWPGIDNNFNQDDADKRVWNQQEPAKDRELFLDRFAHIFEHDGYPETRRPVSPRACSPTS
jgi:hypothetical protein